MSRDREPLISLAFYNLFKLSVVTPAFYTYFRGHIHGIDKVPKRGPLVVVANHASDFDPPFVAAGLCRPVAYMAKQELFQVPLLGPAIRLYGAYPVNRASPDRSAIRSALAQLEAGWMVGIFLQGTRTADARIPSPKLGAAMIAAKAQVPLLPVSIWGTHLIVPKGGGIPRSVPVTVRVGDLIEPPASTKRQDMETVTQTCVSAIHAMHDMGR